MPRPRPHPLLRSKGQSKTYVHPIPRPVEKVHMVTLGARGWGTLQALAAKLGMGESEAMEYVLGQVRVLRGG